MKCAITTVDNPYDPLTDFTNWYLYDVVCGYNTCGYLARIAKTSDVLSETENDKEIERAIDEIIAFHPNLYKKVTSNVEAELVVNV